MEVFQYLSTPFEGDFHALSAELAAAQYRAFCQRAQRLAPTPELAADHLIATVVDAIAARPATVGYWTPEVGSIFAGFGPKALSVREWNWIRAQIIISGHVTGLLDDLECEVEVDSPLQVCGRAIVGEIHISGGHGRLQVRTIDGRTALSFSSVALRHGVPVWAEDDRPSAIVCLEGTPAIRLVGGEWHGWVNQPCDAMLASAEVIGRIEESLELLKRCMPEYYQWVVCLLREVTPIHRPARDTIASNSSALRMGGIDISIPASATEIAEMLIHECSHQYFHMASWLGSPVTPDSKPHYSPLKKCERPLDRILLGYHAFGNAMIGFDRFAELGFKHDIADRWHTISNYLEQLALPLADEAGLNELGKALYRPLHERVTRLTQEQPWRSGREALPR